MTARDTYRDPVSSYEAVSELRRVSGTQLDGRFVEVFAEVLVDKDLPTATARTRTSRPSWRSIDGSMSMRRPVQRVGRGSRSKPSRTASQNHRPPSLRLGSTGARAALEPRRYPTSAF